MNVEFLHARFDGLKSTIQTEVSPVFRAKLVEAKARAIESNQDCFWVLAVFSLPCDAPTAACILPIPANTGQGGIFSTPNRPPNNPGNTVNFRTPLLNTGGSAMVQGVSDMTSCPLSTQAFLVILSAAQMAPRADKLALCKSSR